jgi:formylglycine-generating enzyme required for sulfatase activity
MSKKLLFIILVISQITFAQKTTKSNSEFLKLNGKKVPFVFVGKTNLYACQFEVSNYEYLCFLDWTRKTKGENEYQKNLPDTLVWRSPLGYHEKYCIYYLRHPAFRDYPVIGVSYEQALNYCNWLTSTTNQLLKDKKIKKIQFRLPSEEEWELAARGGMPEGTIFPWGTSSYRVERGKLKGYIRANFNTGYSDNFGLAGTLNDGSNITVSKSEFWPNNYGLYNIAGNVAEMVTEQSICKGGSWYKGSHKMVISTRDTFEIADSWVGIRVFAETEEYQIPESKLNIDATFIQGNLCYLPAGGIQINGYGRTMHDTTDVITQQSFYMSKFEVSNELYVAFLNSIRDSSIQKAFFPKDENWYSETDLLQYQHYTSQFPNHPVVNITKEAMTAFCIWLTDRYNNDPLRRYEYVEFSLPTLEQQLVASSCGLNLCPYSWGGPYKMNAKGEYMMNFNPLLDYVRYDEKKLTNVSAYRRSQLAILKMSRALDGYELTAPVNAFYPCKYGMHNLNGNVAEVVSNSDIVFGGSFADMDENCSNFLIDNYYFLNEPERTSLPSPQVGFRFVMNGIYDQNKHKK